MRYKQKDEHKLSYFVLKAILKTIIRTENIGQIYHRHKISEILNYDITSERGNKKKKKKHYPN